jgi:hypothetical protein
VAVGTSVVSIDGMSSSAPLEGITAGIFKPYSLTVKSAAIRLPSSQRHCRSYRKKLTRKIDVNTTKIRKSMHNLFRKK